MYTKKLDLLLREENVLNPDATKDRRRIYGLIRELRNGGAPIFELHAPPSFKSTEFGKLCTAYIEELRDQNSTFRLPYPEMILAYQYADVPGTQFFFLTEVPGPDGVVSITLASSFAFKEQGRVYLLIDPYFVSFECSTNRSEHMSMSVWGPESGSQELYYDSVEELQELDAKLQSGEITNVEWYTAVKHSVTQTYETIYSVMGFLFALDKGIVAEKQVRGKPNSKSLIRAGAPSRTDYRVLTLCPTKKRAENGGGSRGPQKFHYRRGHWRHFAQPTKEGKMQTWIPAYTAGDIRLGIVVKDYTVSDEVMAQAIGVPA
jgi:hypothetical protein